MNRFPKIRAHRWKICLKTSQVLAFPANLNLRLVLPQSISLSKFQNNFTAEFEDLLSYGILLQRFLWNFCGIPITSKKNFKKSMFGLLKLFLVRMVHVVRQGARSIDLFTTLPRNYPERFWKVRLLLWFTNKAYVWDTFSQDRGTSQVLLLQSTNIVELSRESQKGNIERTLKSRLST